MNKKYNYISIVLALLVLILSWVILYNYSQNLDEIKTNEYKSKLYEILISKKASLEKTLNSRIFYTKSVASLISINPDNTQDEFTKYAKVLIGRDSVINSMALSKDCILSVIYPYEGHESVIGLKLLDHPDRKVIVEKTVKTQKTFVAGPVKLIEGGIAFISYTPIFTESKLGFKNFWGVSDIVILKDKLLNEAHIYSNEKGIEYALQGKDGTGDKGEVFFGNNSVFERNPLKIDILLPYGTWVLACVPNEGWKKTILGENILIKFLYLGSFIISFLTWLSINSMLKIRKNEKDLTALFSSMKDMIIEFNANGDYLAIAPTNEYLLIKDRNYLVGKNLKDVFDIDTANFFLNAIQECINTKNLVVIDYPLTIKQHEYWFQARISYVNENSVLYLAHDNTLRKMLEDELKHSEKQFRFLTEHSADIIWQLNDKFIFTYVNLADERIRGFSQKEVLGSSFWDAVSVDYISLKEDFAELMKKYTINDDFNLLKNYQLKMLCKDGSYKWCEINSLPVYDDIGNLTGFYGVTRDISERIKMIQELKQLNNTKDKFFSIIAHDLRNPISNFHQISKLLFDKYDDLELNVRQQLLQEIKESSNNIYELLENLLTWSSTQTKKISWNPSKVDLKDLIDRSSSLYISSLAHKKVSFINNLKKELYVWSDVSLLSTILRNLINNAIKYSNSYGEIILNVEPYLLDKNMLLLSIKDNGVGIASEHLGKLFKIDNTFSTHGTANESGTGLGLILCKEFIELNGGTIWCESKLGIGTTFFFTVPIYNNQ